MLLSAAVHSQCSGTALFRSLLFRFFLKNIARIQLVTAKELLPMSKLTTTCCVACSGMLPIPRKESSFQTPSKRFPF